MPSYVHKGGTCWLLGHDWVAGPDSLRPTNSCFHSLAPKGLPEMNLCSFLSSLNFPSQQVLSRSRHLPWFSSWWLIRPFPQIIKTQRSWAKPSGTITERICLEFSFAPLKILGFSFTDSYTLKNLLWKFKSFSPSHHIDLHLIFIKNLCMLWVAIQDYAGITQQTQNTWWWPS